MTTEETFDPFAPQEGGNKTKFGKLKVYANRVVLEKGAAYQVKEIHDRDGNVRQWGGKRVSRDSKQAHIILHVKTDDKDGNEYEMAKDYMTFDKAYKSIVHPALVKVFGDTKSFPTTAYVPVKLEEVSTGEQFTGRDGSVVDKTAWKVVAKYATEAAMKAAEKEYFSRFTSTSNGATEAAAEPNAYVPEGWTAEAWEKLKPKLRKSLAAGKSAEQVASDYDLQVEYVEALK